MKFASLHEVKVPVQLVIGETELTVKEISELNNGSLIRMNSLAGEPVVLLAAGEEIARGDVVVMDENFGIRISSLTGRKQEK
ncbi:MAG: FliM/FliN family flagellar motor switch protein [Spirochaetales bacterium]|nr:FliM/FliN family flagellar motor switch protein [Spirochaetales bacterium]